MVTRQQCGSLWRLFIVLTVLTTSTLGTPQYGSRCYDCNFSPSEVPKERGTNHCALQTYADAAKVDKWACQSGQCFIRIDQNGMVYRGCANEENLPWGVRTNRNCQYQGPKKSLWWFCEGDLCNDGVLGESEERCGEPEGYDNEYQGTSHDSSGQRQSSSGYANRGYSNYPQGDSTRGNFYNPCDGRCENNPSGLFADPYAPDHFIQCGRSMDNGKPCRCCRQYRLKCPYNTEFDPSTNVCSRMKY